MPRRNLAIIAVMLVVAFVCYQKVQTNRYSRILTESMEIVERNALADVKDKQLFEGAMNGMMNALGDDYSYYMPPAAQNELDEQLNSKFVRIGVEITLDPKTREIVVLSPLYDSPAYKAGVLAGDRLLRINNRSTQGMSLNDATELLRGKAGEKVTLTVLHPGENEPRDLEIVRSEIHVDTVLGDTRDAKGTWNYFLPGTDKIGYLRITSFSLDTAAELERALTTLADQHMKGLILDLRDDLGGLLPIACGVCDFFLTKGDAIVTTRGREKTTIFESHAASGGGRFTEIPLAVLVNQYSASASEIVAACLQDHHRAAIIGQRTFGKGTVQQLIDLEKDCGALRLTTASYWRPSEKNIHRKHGAAESDEWGVQPDAGCKVVVEGDDLKKWYLWRMHRDAQPDASEDYRSADRQLEKAVECLQKVIK